MMIIKTMFLVVLLLVLSGCEKKEAPVPVVVAKLPAIEQDTIMLKMLDTMKGDMKDPSSVQFRGTKAEHGAFHRVCGEMNAKNSYGGYVGFKKFVIIAIPGESFDYFFEKENDNGFYERWWKDSPCNV